MRGAQATVMLLSLSGTASAGLDCTPRLLWSWSITSPDVHSDSSQPIVGRLADTNGDGAVNAADPPTLVYARCFHNSTPGCVLTALNGRTGLELFTTATPTAESYLRRGAAIGDVDRDGRPDLVGLSSRWNQVRVFDGSGALVVAGPTLPTGFGWYDSVGLADLDHDGSPEVYSGASVMDGAGRLEWQGSFGQGNAAGFATKISNAVDLIAGNGGLELVAGGTVYDRAGTVLWRAPAGDGWTATGDISGDGPPEVVLVGKEEFRLLDAASGAVLVIQSVPSGIGASGYLAQPTLADLDGNGSSEIVVAQDDRVEAYRYKDVGGAPGLELAWTAPNTDASRGTALAAFDFDGDGAAELIQHDELEWRVLDGRDGSALWSEPFATGTAYESPVVVDVDGDCATDIIISGSWWYTTTVSAYRCDSVMRARPVWNQFAYHVTNIADDGVVPIVEPAPWRTGAGWLAQSPGEVGIAAAHSPQVSVCAGERATLDGSPSSGCGQGLEYRWLVGTTEVCGWSGQPTCEVQPAVTTAYTLEVRCRGTGPCGAGGTAAVLVDVVPDVQPGDLGNSLRGIRQDVDVAVSWASAPSARTYNLRRSERKGSWPPAPLVSGLSGTTASLGNEIPAPPSLYFYRASGSSCSGLEGP